MAESLTAYLDESGATGRNLQDPAQPYFILAGWLCEPTDERLSDAVATARGRRAELKGAGLLRNPRGRTRGAHLLRDALESGAIPLVSVTEKRFALVAKIVEYFLEPTLNSALDMDFELWDRADVKTSFANLLFELPEQLTTRIWVALTRRPPDQREVERALRSVIAECSARGHSAHARALKGSLTYIAEICALSFSQARGSTDALAAPALNVVLRQLHEVAERLGVDAVDVRHDETVEFGPALETVWSNAQEGYSYPPSFDVPEVLRTGSDRLRRFELVDSTAEPRLQAADVLAAAIAKTLAAPSGGDVSDLELRTLETLASSVANGLFWLVGSEQSWLSLAQRLRPTMNDGK